MIFQKPDNNLSNKLLHLTDRYSSNFLKTMEQNDKVPYEAPAIVIVEMLKEAGQLLVIS